MKKARIILIIIAIIVVFCILCIFDMSKNMKAYDVIHVGVGKIKVPEYIYDESQIYSVGESVLINSDNYIIIGIDLPSTEISETITSLLGLSDIEISNIINFDSEENLKELFKVNDDSIIKMGHVNKPSFNKYMIRYKTDNEVYNISCCYKDNHCMVHIIKAKEQQFSEKELDYMTSGLSY